MEDAVDLQRYEQMTAVAGWRRTVDRGEISIPPGPRLGTLVVKVRHLTNGFAGRTLIDDLSCTPPCRGNAGVIGPNGAGKTTLFTMLDGGSRPTPAPSGSVTRCASRTSTRPLELRIPFRLTPPARAVGP